MGKNEMNIRLKAVWLGASMALIGSMITPAMADEWNKKTEFEFNSPVAVPGKVLDAGKYVFQLLDTQDRNIVQIFSVDPEGNQRLVTTIMAVPAYLVNVPDKPTIRFEERPGDSPEAIRSWFYPGDNYGWEFVYPKSERLATSSDLTSAVPPAPEQMAGKRLYLKPIVTANRARPCPKPLETEGSSSWRVSQCWDAAF